MCTISQLCSFLWSLLSFLLVFPCFFSKGIGLCITLVHSMSMMYLHHVSSKRFDFLFFGFLAFFTIKLCMYLLHFCSYIISYHLNVRYSCILFYKCFHILFYIEFSKPSGIFFAVCTNVKIYLVLFSKCLNLPGAAVSSQFLCSSLQRALLRSKPTCCLSSPYFLSCLLSASPVALHHQGCWSMFGLRQPGPSSCTVFPTTSSLTGSPFTVSLLGPPHDLEFQCWFHSVSVQGLLPAHSHHGVTQTHGFE